MADVGPARRDAGEVKRPRRRWRAGGAWIELRGAVMSTATDEARQVSWFDPNDLQAEANWSRGLEEQQALEDAGWPPLLARAAEEQLAYAYACGVSGFGVLHFTRAEDSGGGWVRLH